MTVEAGRIGVQPSGSGPVEWAEGPEAISGLAELLRDRTWTALTGAGASTDSGIPDYRGPTSIRATPMQYAEFVRSTSAQQRYWARSYLGWTRMGHAHPNDGHRALVDLESAGLMGVVTQNVDGLHSRAGSRTVVNLHGEIAWVVCLDCGDRTRRADVQRRLTELNPGLDGSAAGRARRAASRRRRGGARSGSTSSWPTARPAVDGSSPMSSSSASRCPRTGCSSPTTWSTRARCWSCSGPRSR